MIEVIDLHKTFDAPRWPWQRRDRHEALAGVSFACRPGRIFCLLGPNGAGKTTTLRLIAALLRPTAGTVRVNGFDVVRDPEAVKRQLGFLTGATALYDRLTPNELVRYYAELHDVPAKQWRRMQADLFELLGMRAYANRRIGKLSTGMKQKVSIVRTMIHDPNVLVFDEVTAGLDVIAARSIIDLVRRCREAGKTVIFSTHRMDEVSLLADDLAIMHQGRLCYVGSYPAFLAQMRTASLEDEFIRIVEESALAQNGQPRMPDFKLSAVGVR